MSVDDLVRSKYQELGFRLHNENEWTVLAGIIMCDTAGKKVISLGTGVKCLPQKVYQNGNLRYQLVRDCHAEVLARRGLIGYLAHQIKLYKEKDIKCVLVEDDDIIGKFKLKEGIRFEMYISQAPCGDASMHILSPNASPESPLEKRPKLIRGRNEVGRTGVIRTKPGRADAPSAPSASCSDKIALWSLLGWQGSICSHFIPDPIIIKKFIIGERFDLSSLEGGISRKGPLKEEIEFLEAEKPFKYSFKLRSSDLKCTPTNISQVWFEGGRAETLTDGRLQGSLKPKGDNLPVKSQSSVCTQSLIRHFYGLIGDGRPPLQIKISNEDYQNKKIKLFEDDMFQAWPQSNDEMLIYRTNKNTR